MSRLQLAYTHVNFRPFQRIIAFGLAALCHCHPWLAQAQGLQWTPENGYRSAPLPVPGAGRTGFRQMPGSETGIHFTNVLAQDRSLTNQIYLNGSGVAAGDIDGDGLCDLYFCGLDNANVLYRNLGGWRFEDITAAAGVACPDQASTGAVFADVDGDGDLDLLVAGIRRGVRLFLNDGKGRFHEATAEAGLSSRTGATSMTLGDIDGDGLLDLYVVNYRSNTLRDEPDTRFKAGVTNGVMTLLSVDGRPATAPDLVGRFTVDPVMGILENGEADVLFRNEGNGKFRALSWTDGRFIGENGKPASVPYDWGLAAMFRDINGDGAPDLYVCNDFQSEDRVWINDGTGRFRAIEKRALRHTSLFSMGVDFADLDRDGRDEFFVADMLSREHVRRQIQVAQHSMAAPDAASLDSRPQYPRNTLFWNRGDSYAEIAPLSGVEASDWSWCPVFLDVDLDGYEDLLVTTGHERDAQHADIAMQIDTLIKQKPRHWVERLRLRGLFPKLDTPNFAFRNRGDLTFEEAGGNWGFDSRQISHGIALADLDNDGDLDVVVSCLNAPPLLYRNETAAPRLAVRLKGKTPNTRGIGARVAVRGGPVPQQSQEIIAGGRYLSGDDAIRSFAAGSLTNRLTIEVTWRSGARSLATNVLPNRIFEIEESAASPAQKNAPESAPTSTWFEDKSNLLAHRHQDEPFNDFERQPLLSRKLSQLGPGVSWFDVDEDGWDDLIIGGGKGGKFSAYRNNRNGTFSTWTNAFPSLPLKRDQTAVLGWRGEGAGEAVLLAGWSNYEDASMKTPALSQFPLGPSARNREFPAHLSSTGPLALGDVDGDGDLDLFVGGRVVPGRYPEAASSLFFRNEQGALQLDPELNKAFAGIGMVSGALWSDLTGDGLPELILACEWGPIRIFRWTNGRFQEATREFGLDQHIGWWNSIQAGDFDNDGRIDLIAGNWGRNTRYQSFLKEPIRLYYGDYDGDQFIETVEAYFDPELRKIVPWQHFSALGRSLPFLQERFRSFTEFSTASVSDLLGERMAQTREVQANTLDSMLFLNRGGRFSAHALPLEAQLAPVFGIAVADFNGDGNEDVFLAQNFFGVPPEVSRYDAGTGVLLFGDGHGNLAPVPRDESGLSVIGEGRAVAAADYDQDGRIDLAVAQNGAETRLFRNNKGRPGLIVRPSGPAGNREGIGVAVRIEYVDGTFGPLREVRAGGGYWSQDSSTMVIGLARAPKAVHATWPGGTKRIYPVSNNNERIEIRAD